MGIRASIKNFFAPKKRALNLTSTEGWSLFSGVGSDVNLPAISEKSSLKFITIFACVDRITNDLAGMPFNIYEDKEGERRVAKKHPAYRLLKREPNKRQSSFDLRKILFAHALLWGNGYCHKKKDALGKIMSFDILMPWETRAFLVKDEIWYKDFKNGIIIPSEDMIHIKGLGSTGIEGLSRIKLHQESIASAFAANRMKAKRRAGGGLFSGVIEGEKALTQEALDRLSSSFASNYGGIDNMHKFPVLFSGFKFKPVSMPWNDMQFIENAKFDVEEICRMFSCPPHLVGHLERSTNNNIEKQSTEYVQYTLLPWATCAEQEFDRKLFRGTEDGDFFVKLELKNLLRGDIKARGEFYKILFGLGVLSANDIRKLEEMNTVEYGDYRFVPLNHIPTSKIEDYDYAKNK